ncbi:MAG: MarC family protein [Candidatus Kaistia colombiensis]|nr:MAG: MarC family protein [Kaistia sp.]
MDITFAIKIFSAMFAIMNPIANLPIFLSLTAGMAQAEQRRTAILVTATVAIGSVISALAGTAILGFFGLDVNHFRLAGGLIVLLIALSMLQGDSHASHAGSSDEQQSFKSASNVAFYPFSIPILLGPGTISALVVYAHQARATGEVAAFSIGLVAFVALLGTVLISGPFIGRVVSPTIMSVTKRLMGMILAAIAMEMLVASLTALFPGWAG